MKQRCDCKDCQDMVAFSLLSWAITLFILIVTSL